MLLYYKGIAYQRTAKTKITSCYFWYLSCCSKGQAFSEELHDPYTLTQHHLSVDSKTLLLFQFSISTLSYFELFSASKPDAFYEMKYPRWVFWSHMWGRLTAAERPPFLYARQVAGFFKSTGSAFPTSRAKPTLLLNHLSYKPPSKHPHCNKARPCAK